MIKFRHLTHSTFRNETYIFLIRHEWGDFEISRKLSFFSFGGIWHNLYEIYFHITLKIGLYFAFLLFIPASLICFNKIKRFLAYTFISLASLISFYLQPFGRCHCWLRFTPRWYCQPRSRQDVWMTWIMNSIVLRMH